MSRTTKTSPTTTKTSPTTARDLIDQHSAVREVDAEIGDLDQRRERAAQSIGEANAAHRAAVEAHAADLAAAVEQGRAPEVPEPVPPISDADRADLTVRFKAEADRLDARRAAVVASIGAEVEAEVNARAAALGDRAAEHVHALAEIAGQADDLQRVLIAVETARVVTEERERGVRRDMTTPARVDTAAVVEAVERGRPVVQASEPRRRLGLDSGSLHQPSPSAPEPPLPPRTPAGW